MDLRAARSRVRQVAADVGDRGELELELDSDSGAVVPYWEVALKLASTIAAEARAAVKVGWARLT